MAFFSGRRQEAHAQELAVLEKPKEVKPQPIARQKVEAPTKQYLALCSKLKYEPIGLEDSKFHNFCFDNEIPIYNDKQVYDFLEKKRKKAGVGYSINWINLKDYTKLIPERVLKHMGKIKEEFPECHFQVSDIIYDPDPFARAYIGRKWFVFAVWDEPGFSG